MPAHSKKLPIDAPLLRSHLKLKHLQSEFLLTTHHAQAVALLKAAGVRPGKIRQHASRALTSGLLTASLFLTPGQQVTHAQLPESAKESPLVSAIDLKRAIQDQLQPILKDTSSLSPDQELQISTVIHQIYGVHASAELEGNRLNQAYGFMGFEQHLPRYPGDTISAHETNQASGITPGRGAWGYFANSKQGLTEELVQMEKYYVAVQTLYLPDWSTRLAYLRDWYKHRKVVVVNPKNGKAIIAAIADAGPAAWTGKSFGGSPEVIEYLNLRNRNDYSAVILFFVDDVGKTVPFGPVEYNLEAGPSLLSSAT